MTRYGVSDWLRGVTDQLAKEGFIAIAPDSLSGMGPNKGGSVELGEQAEMAKAKASYDPHIFEGAGHGFLRQQAGNANAPGNLKAAEQAWPLTLEFLKTHTK